MRQRCCVDIGHRAAQHRAGKRFGPVMQITHGDMRPHGMGQNVIWRWKFRRCHYEAVEKTIQVAVIFGKVPHMPFMTILQMPIRKSLTAPVKRGHRKAARAQFANGFEIFFDKFRAPLQDHHRSPDHRRCILRPVHGAQFNRIIRAQPLRHGARRAECGHVALGALRNAIGAQQRVDFQHQRHISAQPDFALGENALTIHLA